MKQKEKSLKISTLTVQKAQISSDITETRTPSFARRAARRPRRIFSDTRNDVGLNLLSDSDVQECEQIHLHLMDKLEKRVNDTKLARFRGFASRNKLMKVLQLGSFRMCSPPPTLYRNLDSRTDEQIQSDMKQKLEI